MTDISGVLPVQSQKEKESESEPATDKTVIV